MGEEEGSEGEEKVAQLKYKKGGCMSMGVNEDLGCDDKECKGNKFSDASLQKCDSDDKFQQFAYISVDASEQVSLAVVGELGGDVGLLRSSAPGGRCLTVSKSAGHKTCEPLTLQKCKRGDPLQHFEKEGDGAKTIWRNPKTKLAPEAVADSGSKVKNVIMAPRAK